MLPSLTSSDADVLVGFLRVSIHIIGIEMRHRVDIYTMTWETAGRTLPECEVAGPVISSTLRGRNRAKKYMPNNTPSCSDLGPNYNLRMMQRLRLSSGFLLSATLRL